MTLAVAAAMHRADNYYDVFAGKDLIVGWPFSSGRQRTIDVRTLFISTYA
jgi:hypothetical protein